MASYPAPYHGNDGCWWQLYELWSNSILLHVPHTKLDVGANGFFLRGLHTASGTFF